MPLGSLFDEIFKHLEAIRMIILAKK